MDNRLAGLLIVIAALLFLWLYQTGRWSGIVSVVKGVSPTPASLGSAQSNAVSAQYGAICSIWPESCTASSQTASATGTGSHSGTGQSVGGSVGGLVGNIFGPVGGAIGSALGGIFGGLFG